MTEQYTYLNISFGLPIDGPFTYKVDSDCVPDDILGRRVLVHFRNRLAIGYVVALCDTPPAGRRIKKIDDFLDIHPVLDQTRLALTQWISDYYLSSWGEAIENALPAYLKTKRKCFTRIMAKSRSSSSTSENQLKELTLNDEQAKALEVITESITRGTEKEFLLYGITGSGKTEVYIRAIEEALRQGKTAICLFPEIALTKHLEESFEAPFGPELAILHSRLNPVNKFKLWREIREGKRKVVIGPRSALFAPLKNIGVIVVDEMHENTYKQNDVPRYHAYTVAKKLSELEGATLITGGATPSLEIMHNALQKKAQVLTLKKRIVDRPLPEVHVIDMKNEVRRGHVQMISQFLRDRIEKALAEKESVLLFLNRRGYATTVTCMKCGSVIECKECKLALTYHQSNKKLMCHYCDGAIQIPDVCPSCAHASLRYGGAGTERVESYVARMFPQAKIERLDTDRVKKKGEHEKILNAFKTQKIDILIGTQMITKGFDFPNVTLVGVINADTVLTLPDFRSTERTFQLLTQVAGRAGRGSKKGTVVVQTFTPNHYSIQTAKEHDFDAFYAEEIKSRKELNYPPFTKIVNIIIRDSDEKKVCDFGWNVRSCVETECDSRARAILGPAPLPFYHLRGYYRWHVMVKLDGTASFDKTIKKKLESIKRPRSTQFAIDIDAVNIL